MLVVLPPIFVGGDKINLQLQFCSSFKYTKLVIFKPLSYCFEEITGLDVKISFVVSSPVSRLIR